MAGTNSKKGTATATSSGKFKFIIIYCILFLIPFILLIASIVYATKCDEISVLLDYYTETLVAVLVTLLGGGIAGISKTLEKKTKLFCAIVVAVILSVIFAMGLLKVYSSSAKPAEKITISEPIVVNVPDTSFVKSPYIFESDPYIENLEAYCGVEKGSIPESDIVTKKANLIIGDIEMLPDHSLSDEEPPKGYTDSIRRADKLYNCYTLQRNTYWDDDEDFALLQEVRFIDLELCKTERETATIHHKCPDNLRNLAIYCKDKGDEHLRYIVMVPDADLTQKQTDALNEYNAGAHYCMESIRLAGAAQNYKQMSKALTIFHNITTAVFAEHLESTSLGIQICEAYNVYKLVVELCSRP